MRVLFSPFSTPPHVYNIAPLAWAMQTAGHDVRVAGHPDIAGKITSAGLTAVSVGQDLNIQDAVDTWPGDEFMNAITDSVGLRVTTDTRRDKWMRMLVLGSLSMYFSDDFPTGGHAAMVDELVDYARSWRPDLIVWDAVSVPGAVAARASAAASARMLFGLDIVGQMRTAFTSLPESEQSEQDSVTEWLSGTLHRFGCEFDEEILLGQWSIDPMPSWMRLPVDQPSVSLRYIAYNWVGSIPKWVDERPERPRICVTLGISQREVWGRDSVLISDLLAAVAELDVEVIATLSKSQQAAIGTVPDNVRLVEFVPLNALLPTCSAIVHHGGGGTFSNAAVHGVPQLIVPIQLWDEELIGERVARRGSGLVIPPSQLDPDNLAAALGRLLDEPSFVAGAREVQEGILSTPSPNEVVSVLERLTENRRPVLQGAR
ncbi:MAG: activator-dependent family glycosyltransferase [Pseudonocardiaceae bacterium]